MKINVALFLQRFDDCFNVTHDSDSTTYALAEGYKLFTQYDGAQVEIMSFSIENNQIIINYYTGDDFKRAHVHETLDYRLYEVKELT